MTQEESPKPQISSLVRDQMANERTFLAWVRTSIGIMAFGFVVEKFALFIKQITIFLDQSHAQVNLGAHSLQGYSSIIGIFLVAFGTLMPLLAFIKYLKDKKQIENGTYQASILLNVILILCILFIGVFLVLYLNKNI